MLEELAVVATVAVFVTVALARLNLPTVAGLLAAGALVGPHGLSLAPSVKAIEALAEVGVVLLLFSIGLELSLARLRDIFQQVALGGLIQVGLTTAVACGVSFLLGEPLGRSVFYGFAFALSSTAIVLRALGERRELDAPHGRFIVGTLVFQDLCVVPMVLVVPMLASLDGVARPGEVATQLSGTQAAATLFLALGKAVVVVVVLVALARVLVPRLLDAVDASRSREVFLLAILGLCIGTAWLTSLAGLSLALGAFLGGMLVADTQYGHRAMGDILPLRDTFVSLFFVSLGMLFDVRIVLAQPVLVAALVLGFILGKGLLATLAAIAMRFPARAAWLAGVGLAQFGEFGFVLTRLAGDTGLVDESHTAPLFAAGILSMFVTPLVVRIAPHITAGERLLAPLERAMGVASIDQADEPSAGGHASLRDHVVLVGLGVAGMHAAASLETAGVRFVALELNAENVRRGRAAGLPAYYGDATSDEALAHAHVADARMVVLLMNDAKGARRIVDTLRRVAPEVPVLSRTRYLAERADLLTLGAHSVVVEEVEGAARVIERMLRTFGTDEVVVATTLRNLRSATDTVG